MKKVYIGTLLMALFANAFADEASVRKAFEANYPDAKIQSVTKTPYANLYELFIDGNIYYADDEFSFFIDGGHIIKPAGVGKPSHNVTVERLTKLNHIDFSKLPLEHAIKVVKGDGSRKMVVFSDPDCPYCKRLEQNELVQIDNVTIYTFMLPLPMHPDAANKANAIWCAPDRAKAWTNWVMNDELPDNFGTCKTPLAQVFELAGRYGVGSTPLIVLENGQRIKGAYPASEIEHGLQQAAASKK